MRSKKRWCSYTVQAPSIRNKHSDFNWAINNSSQSTCCFRSMEGGVEFAWLLSSNINNFSPELQIGTFKSTRKNLSECVHYAVFKYSGQKEKLGKMNLPSSVSKTKTSICATMWLGSQWHGIINGFDWLYIYNTNVLICFKICFKIPMTCCISNKVWS